MIKKIVMSIVGVTVGVLPLAIAPISLAAPTMGSWGVWSEGSPNTLTFSGSGTVNATWSITGTYGTKEILDTQSEDEFFAVGTPIGAVFGTNGPSATTNFLKIESPSNTSQQSTVTVTFKSPVPAGQLGFAVSDLDTDHVVVTAKGANGAQLRGTRIVGTANNVAFNFCGQSSGPACSDTGKPKVVSGTNQVKLTGSLVSSDGSSAWFRPNVDVKSVAFTYANDDSRSSSTIRYWFVQDSSKATSGGSNGDVLARTGANSTTTLGVLGMAAVFVAVGVFLVGRKPRSS